MGTVDFILNLAGLLLWLNWRSNRFDPLVRRSPATLMGTLRPAAPKKLPQQTMVIPQGVKLGQEPSTTVTFEKTAFPKKSNTGTKIFIGVIIVIGIVVIVLLLLMLKQSGGI